MLFDAIAGLVKGLITGWWSALFPAKTAADQKVVDLTTQTKETRDANRISDQVEQKTDMQLDDDLARRVRPESNT